MKMPVLPGFPVNTRHLLLRQLKRQSIWLLSALVTALLLAFFLTGKGISLPEPDTVRYNLTERFDMAVSHITADALQGVLAVEKVYWLQDEDLIAPEPDPEKYGSVTDPRELSWLPKAAEKLLDGQSLFFDPEVETLPNSKVKYYLDDTILAVTWKQGVGLGGWTVTEVMIADPSQFRRFHSDGKYGSPHFYTTTHMAAQVNAVAASSGDYYAYRQIGTVVNNGTVYRSETRRLDTCFVDDKGDLHFVPKNTFSGKEAVEQYVKENNIRFSLAFGPILLEKGENKIPRYYPVGEQDENYSRAAICQLGPRHYLLIAVNIERYYYLPPTLHTFAKQLKSMGIENAYALDGGQTATIVTGDERMNKVDYGDERYISDIVYFATAIPN